MCEDNHVRASYEAGCRSINLMAPNQVAEVGPNAGKSGQKKASVSCTHALCKCVLLFALSIIQIGCRAQSKNRFSLPKNPRPLPAPRDQIEMGAVHRQSGQFSSGPTKGSDKER